MEVNKNLTLLTFSKFDPVSPVSRKDLCLSWSFALFCPLEILTQNVTQNIESRRGAERIDLRVLGDFRPKKAQKALGPSCLTSGPQLITRRSEVQVLLPQP